DVSMAAGRRTCRPREDGSGEPAGSSPLHARHYRAAGQGSPRDGHRPGAHDPASSGVGLRTQAGGRRAVALGDVAHARVGEVRRGVRLVHVLLEHQGTSRVVLDDVSLSLPPDSVVAIVGENGAGKTPLVKLLAKMYEPTSGAILVDDAPLARMRADEWRERVAGAFQDFFRFEFRALHTVGLGDVPRVDDEPAVVTAIGRAGADDVVTRLTAGLGTQLGPT